MEIGSLVAHYRIIGQIGEGGMGVVYKAEDTKLERVVALKFLSSGWLPLNSRQRFIHEARAAAKIQHPNVCPVYEISEHDGRLFFAMAFVEGQTILETLESGPLPVSKALELAIQITSGIAAAHRLGIVHRDIKSSNIVIDRTGRPVILDFGLAVQADEERLTLPGGTSGTPSYMSPEQAQALDVDHRTDIWAVGVILFEMLTGRLPFRGDNQLSILYAIVNQSPRGVVELRPQVPDTVRDIIDKALAKDPNQRWQSAAQMGNALQHAYDQQSHLTQTVTSFQNIVHAPPVVRKIGSWKPLMAGAVALLLGAAGYFGFRTFHPSVEPLPEQKQIAVLPFEIIGNQNDQTVRALADGLVETLTAKLSQVEDFQGRLVVVPASEIRSRKITTSDEARRIYGANLVLTGSAQRWGNKIQFNEVLVDTATVRQLGSKSFEFDDNKSIDIRDRAVSGAVRLLQLKLAPATVSDMGSGETTAPEAYAEYLKGVGYLARYDVAGNIDRAIGSLKNAISADPKYALAHAALGEAYWEKAKQTADKQQAALALSSIQLALQLDPRLTAAHIKLGQIYSENGESALAIDEEKNALQIASCSGQAYLALGDAYSAAGKFSDAEDAYKHGVECQPADWLGHVLLGYFYVERGRMAEARTAYEIAQNLTPDNEVVLSNLAGLDLREGKFQDAVNLYSRSLKFKPGPGTYASLGITYYYQHRYQDAADALLESSKLAPENYRVWGNLGTVYRHLPGKEESAREAFQKAVALASKTLDVMHGDFRAHANLAEYWAKLGDSQKAMAEFDQIPEASRGPFVDRLVLVYTFAGDRRRAIETLRTLPQSSPAINLLKNDPDLASLWPEVLATNKAVPN